MEYIFNYHNLNSHNSIFFYFYDYTYEEVYIPQDAEIEQQGKENGNEPMSGNRPGNIVCYVKHS